MPELQLPQTDRLYLNGAWQTAGGDRSIEVVNPATATVIATVREASTADVNRAVDAAAAALPAWSATPARVRADYINAIAERILARKQELAALITAEMGMPAQFCLPVQVEGPAAGMASYADRAAGMETRSRAGTSLVLREPVGVCGFITPWNYPLHQIVGKCAPALAAGCTMVLKPSELTPLDAIVFAEIIAAVGLPAGVFNLVQGTGVPVGEALVAHPRVDMVSFTGSTRAGTRIAALAAPSVKRVCLELGGKSPYIITEDADFAAAIDFGVRQVMINSGQSCDALTRMLLPASRYEEGVALAREVTESLVVGDPTRADTDIGPVSSRAQQQRVQEYLRSGLTAGARLVCGGPDAVDGQPGGAFVRPTLFADVSNDMTIAREEIFGPVIAMIPYTDIDQAVALANDTPYGLSGGVWAADNDAAVAIARRLRAGQVYINGGDFNYEAPFGGYKQSGNGREWGDAGLEEFIEIKALQFAAGQDDNAAP
ncbi:aldehyde dehydrogenase family protein [Exilibacterium tricleocarpae]|uniref:Aldehyde dehydrogenase family protein n=1 Tax=Exilibacterium tricleocarpae TaxID=2591008 RepID=A0A545TLV3_9GAMM|nr:aldehyde dehydrogenase family protein [Exilibacterium tricleocarpae]TQV78212.1 aldehyde dehydrogenase family protein [Exilibacterium tricleocarpae]